MCDCQCVTVICVQNESVYAFIYSFQCVALVQSLVRVCAHDVLLSLMVQTDPNEFWPGHCCGRWCLQGEGRSSHKSAPFLHPLPYCFFRLLACERSSSLGVSGVNKSDSLVRLFSTFPYTHTQTHRHTYTNTHTCTQSHNPHTISLSSSCMHTQTHTHTQTQIQSTVYIR